VQMLRGCVREGVRAWVRGCVHACVRACVRACVHVCVRSCVRAYVRVYEYAHLSCASVKISYSKAVSVSDRANDPLSNPLSSTNANTGTRLTISGNGFTKEKSHTQVFVGGDPCHVQIATMTHIECVLTPRGATTAENGTRFVQGSLQPGTRGVRRRVWYLFARI